MSLAWANPYCSPENNQNEKTLASFKQDVVDPWKNFCGDLQAISRNQPPKTEPICKSLWEGGEPWWKKIAESHPEQLNKFSAEFKNPSRRELEKNGMAVKTTADKKAEEKAFNDLKQRTAGSCCGSDSECKKLYVGTSLTFCSSPAADANPDLPDECAGSSEAYFNPGMEGHLAFWFQRNKGKMTDDYKAQTLAALKEKYPNFNPNETYSGTVSTEKYKRGTNISEYVLRHELGHACDFVRQELMLKRGEKFTFKSSFGTSDYREDGACQESADNAFYFEIADNLVPASQAVGLKACIKDRLTKETSDPRDYAYMEGACYGFKVTEATGDTFAALTAKNDKLPNLIHTLCFNGVDPIHFSGYSTLECVAKNVKGFAQRAAEAVSCPK